MAKDFNTLIEPIRSDPVRAARVAEYRDETLREIVAYQLAELRRDLGIDQRELAARLGMSQAGISKLEHSADPKLSTLRKLIEALGGTLIVQAEIDGRTIDLSHGSAA
ncbi:hypothetical protein BH24ACT5_BH24ACT5_00340 [soil metagenome]